MSRTVNALICCNHFSGHISDIFSESCARSSALHLSKCPAAGPCTAPSSSATAKLNWIFIQSTAEVHKVKRSELIEKAYTRHPPWIERERNKNARGLERDNGMFSVLGGARGGIIIIRGSRVGATESEVNKKLILTRAARPFHYRNDDDYCH